MSKVFAAYARQRGINVSSLHFMIDEERINDDDTAETLGLENGDLILCCDCDDSYITVCVRDLTGDSVDYKIKKTTKMSNVFCAYAERKKVHVSSLRFCNVRDEEGESIEENCINDTDTPEILKLEEGANINIICWLNARDTIERLLTTKNCSGKYSTGSEILSEGSGRINSSSAPCCPIPTVAVVLRDINDNETERKTLSFPLNDEDVAKIKNHAERAGVGMIDRTVVNLDVRKTWQIKPLNLDISNIEPALSAALKSVARDLGTETEYAIEAHLYKLLLYEKGCFFARHRDNERLDGMFATLVLELPSVYEGAELSVWSPLTPDEKMAYTFNGGGSGKTPGLHFAAFYADCYHEVSELMLGHRVALVYHLTATPLATRVLPHLPAVSPTPSQPADESIASKLSYMVDALANECDQRYPKAWNEDSYRNTKSGHMQWPGKPKKFAVVLSHNYTPASFKGIQSLKGSDRAIAELIRAAAFRNPVDGAASSDGKPFFDAGMALAVVNDWGEGTAILMDSNDEANFFYTTGPLISLLGGDAIPLDLGPAGRHDLETFFHPSWFGGQEKCGPPFQFWGPRTFDAFPAYALGSSPFMYGEQAEMMMEEGNHSIPIYSHEILFASEEAARKYRKDEDDHGIHAIVEDPKDVEFLGNGCPYEGRIYSRAVILIWPKAHREAIELQTKGGRSVKSSNDKQGSSKTQGSNKKQGKNKKKGSKSKKKACKK